MSQKKPLSREEIFELTYSYVLSVSKQKRYNAQTMANYNLLQSKSKSELSRIMRLTAKEFCASFKCEKVRDFVYKNDGFTPRNMYLINPLHYLYYTYLVFKMVNLLYSKQVDFSGGSIFSFYSGLLNFNASQKDIKKYASFNYSYSLFQEKRAKYVGKPVIRIDIHNFFDNIKVSELISKLRNLFGEKPIISELEYFLGQSGFDNLPQFHYSIASSILSQLYLVEFDTRVEELLGTTDIIMLRFVDDMYLVHTNGYFSYKENNELLDGISSLLWRQGLALNISKTKIFSAEESFKGFEMFAPDYDDSSYSTEKVIEEKAIEVIESGEFLDFIIELCDLERERGVDLKRYQSMLINYLAVNGDDANKVLRRIVYSNKWRNLDVADLEKIIKESNFIYFSPSDFTTLYLKISSFLNVIMKRKGKRKVVLDFLLSSNTAFSYRKSHVAATYLIRRESGSHGLIRNINEINPGYVRFLELFVI